MENSKKMKYIRIGVLGNVDSAKTTLISVLKNNILDNGRGSARAKVFKHKHEIDSGRTSSINHTHIKNNSGNLISFVDLAGHEKYLKTTVFGLNGCSIDYVMILVGANMGVLRMTKEHFKLAIALNIPMFFVITKIDICPDHVLKETEKNILKIIRLGYKNNPKNHLFINDGNLDQVTNNKFIKTKTVPIFKISNITGENLDLLKSFIFNLEPYINYESLITEKPLFKVEEAFFVPGIGCVLSGVVNKGHIKIGDKLILGPFHGEFKPVTIKSIHDNFRNNVACLEAGQSGCFCIKSSKKDNIKKKHIKKGMVLKSELETEKSKNATREFSANILVLHHPTTIRVNYQPVIHCGGISQSAKICEIDKEYLRTGDKARIRFQFMNRPEHLETGTKLMFREGETKGVGKIVEVH